MKKFTFKKVKKEGRYRSFELDRTIIKLEGKEVGCIEETRGDTYIIRFAKKKEKTLESPAPFRWTKLKYRPTTEEAARKYVVEKAKVIQEQLNLFQFED